MDYCLFTFSTTEPHGTQIILHFTYIQITVTFPPCFYNNVPIKKKKTMPCQIYRSYHSDDQKKQNKEVKKWNKKAHPQKDYNSNNQRLSKNNKKAGNIKLMLRSSILPIQWPPQTLAMIHFFASIEHNTYEWWLFLFCRCYETRTSPQEQQ